MFIVRKHVEACNPQNIKTRADSGGFTNGNAKGELCVSVLRGPVMPNNGSSSSGHVVCVCARVILYATV